MRRNKQLPPTPEKAAEYRATYRKKQIELKAAIVASLPLRPRNGDAMTREEYYRVEHPHPRVMHRDTLRPAA